MGWIESEEWLAYTVEAEQEAIYELRVRIARAYGSTGTTRAEIDGTTLSTAVAPTGGWQTWSTQSVGTISIPAGRHRLQLRFPSGGYNLNHLEIERVPSVSQ